MPFGILVAFLGFFLLADPWGAGLLSMVVSVGVLAIPLVVLLVATGAAARVIRRDETRRAPTSEVPAERNG